ncbi:phage head spike fiber domain-containing protein [Lactiplantibacillus pentosus]|uniref:phage head spike fiber domain-containing protein n=1 Tax=Lactiplantibacillus pentosus TaxID=1589 RepID=UPI003D798792
MDKTLEFTTKSPRQIKQGDTETMFTFICKNAGSVVDLTQATSITAKIGNASGYLRSQSIDITSLAGLNPGWLNLQPTPTLISGLPDGDYQLEIWVVDQAGTSIYPSDNPLGFTIKNNIESESGASITTVAFDDFVEAMNKAASTIAKGDPGEGLDIKGQVTSVSALPTTANEGNGYLVNEELYVYTSGAWKDCGPIQGPQGIQGKTGTGISSTTIQYQISNSATTAPTGIWSNNIVATTITNPYLWMKATLNYTDGTTKDFYLVSQKGDKGDKGDTGTVDNAGLTTAPAFVALQTQVNNSAVGTNLYVDTKDFDNPSAWNHWGYSYKTGEKINGLTVMGTKANWSGLGQIIQVKKGDTYTFSVYARYESGTGKSKVFLTPDSGLSVVNIANIQVSLNETWQRVTETVTITSDGQINARIERTDDNTNTLLIAGPKLERGSKATDWCPNPSEILTQADYAKIQAAIVALGGSLS